MLTVSTHRKNVGWSGAEDDAVSSAEENKAIVRRLFKALAEGDLDAMRELLAPYFVDHRIAIVPVGHVLLMPYQLIGRLSL